MPELRNFAKILLLCLFFCSTSAFGRDLPVARAVVARPDGRLAGSSLRPLGVKPIDPELVSGCDAYGFPISFGEAPSRASKTPAKTDYAGVPSDIQASVEFLADSSRLGRRFGTRGAVDAAFFVEHEFHRMGLKTSVDHFRAAGKVGHNVIGVRECPGASKYIVLMANFDGVGQYGSQVYPGADANASGVAAMLSLASSFTSPSQAGRYSGTPKYNLIFAALDGHNESSAGAVELLAWLSAKGIPLSSIALVVNLDTMGSNLAPPQRYWKDYLIVLGGAKYEKSIASCNDGLGLHLYYDYYDSRSFTDMFYRRVGDQAVFVKHGVPAVMVTSGITMRTNKPNDDPASLSFDLLERRTELIRRWLLRF